MVMDVPSFETPNIYGLGYCMFYWVFQLKANNFCITPLPTVFTLCETC